jgi:hypothetical protein
MSGNDPTFEIDYIAPKPLPWWRRWLSRLRWWAFGRRRYKRIVREIEQGKIPPGTIKAFKFKLLGQNARGQARKIPNLSNWIEGTPEPWRMK